MTILLVIGIIALLLLWWYAPSIDVTREKYLIFWYNRGTGHQKKREKIILWRLK